MNIRKQESCKYFLFGDLITVEYDQQFNWIYADWKGSQTEESVKEGCEKMLYALEDLHCSKILNDNTNLTGALTSPSGSVGHDWLRRIKEAGIELPGLGLLRKYQKPGIR